MYGLEFRLEGEKEETGKSCWTVKICWAWEEGVRGLPVGEREKTVRSTCRRCLFDTDCGGETSERREWETSGRREWETSGRREWETRVGDESGRRAWETRVVQEASSRFRRFRRAEQDSEVDMPTLPLRYRLRETTGYEPLQPERQQVTSPGSLTARDNRLRILPTTNCEPSQSPVRETTGYEPLQSPLRETTGYVPF